MQSNTALYILGILFTVFSSCNSERSKTEIPEPLTKEQRNETIKKANEATKALMTRLSSQLKAALISGGPENALHICQQVAQPLTDSTNAELDSLKISRTALKYRNPKNTPSQQDIAILKKSELLQSQAEPIPSEEIVTLGKDQVTIYKPIMTQVICLKCHGSPETFSPELRELITKLYPDDSAVGFKKNALRGAFKIQSQLQIPIQD